MAHRLPRTLLIVLTILSLVAPGLTGVAASATGGAVTLVICTGDGLQTLVIGEDGVPIAADPHSSHCLLAHAADTAVRPEATASAQVLLGAPAAAPMARTRVAERRAARPPPRGPPPA
jgi:hypothetical protein